VSVYWYYAAGKGNYLEMAKADEGAGNRARLISPYMNTTNKCLELYYFIKADDDQAAHTRNLTRLSIVVVSEQLEETTVASVSGSTVDFIRMFTRLPAGVHRLVIEGQRDSAKVECALSTDDVAVMDCTRFGMLVILSYINALMMIADFLKATHFV